MLSLPEEILLLILDDETGKLANASSLGLNYALAGAVLMDLALHSKIDTDLEKLVVVDRTPTGEPILDRYLAQIAAGKQSESTRYWVSELARRGADIQEKALGMLVEKGILRRVEKKFLWVFETRRYPVIDDREEKEVKRRILDVLLTNEIPEPRDVVLICLADTCALFPTILNKREAERLAPRIAQVRKLDLIGQAVSQAVTQLRLDIAAAMPPSSPF
jgi:hypothetical protein